MATTAASTQAPPRGPDLVRGALAATAIVVLVVAVPWALAAFIGWPLPSSIPSWSEVTTALGDSYIPDTFLAKALAVVCWIVWIELMASLLVEAVAVVRGRQAGHVPLTGPTQRLVARLVAAVSLMAILLLTRPDRSVQAVPVPPPAATAALVTSEGEVLATADDATLPTYVVQRRDTLWGIAEAHLRDPFRWVEIWEGNRGLTQPGGATMDDPDRIFPGWVLHLPADAVGLRGEGVPVAETPSSPPDHEAMTPLGPGAAGPGDVSRGGALLVSDGGGGDRVEVIVPLDPRVEPAAPESQLASRTHDGG